MNRPVASTLVHAATVYEQADVILVDVSVEIHWRSSRPTLLEATAELGWGDIHRARRSARAVLGVVPAASGLHSHTADIDGDGNRRKS